MKRLITAVLALILLVGVLSGCSIGSSETYNYKDGYDRLYKDVVEHEYAIEDLERTTVKKFSDGEICVCLGDSVLGGYVPPADYGTVIAEETGLEVINGGISGARMSAHPTASLDAFSMYRIADAIATGDWSLQDANVAELPVSRSADRYAALKAVDWSKADIVTIGFGTMDINGHVAIDDPDDPKATDTVLGALRYSLDRILTAYPHLKIMVLTPTYRYLIDQEKGCDEVLFGGNTYDDYADGLISVAKEYKIPYVDLYRSIGFNSATRSYYFNSNDGTHPNERGIKRIGERIANSILLEF